MTTPETPEKSSPESAAPSPKPASESKPFMIQVKHALLKIIDITALGFLEPVVRLCYGEEPNVQIKKIAKFVVVPIIAFMIFLAVWSYLAPKHKTKSGEVPTPTVVYAAGLSSAQMHEWEMAKKDGYAMEGEKREEEFARATARKAEVDQLLIDTRAALKEAQAARKEEIADELAKLEETYKELRAAQRASKKDNFAALVAEAETFAAGDTSKHTDLLKQIAANEEADKDARAAWQAARDRRNELSKEPGETVKSLEMQITALADEQLFLNSLVDDVGDGSREMRVAKLQADIAATEEAMKTATGADLVKAGTTLIALRESLDQAESSEKAAAATLPYQIYRSVACVFAGFLVGSMIAIPLGVMCGLSTTFMAAMTPFIALFKPVSPIIWLLIFLIITGGFIPDPDDHWLINLLNDMWLTSWIAVNPGFIASAATVAMCSLWATLVNTALGVASVDKDHMNVARVLKLRFHQRLVKIILPSALPLVFAGMRIALGVGWMVLIAAELLANSQGIGVYVWDAYNSGSSDSFAMMFVAVFVVGFIGLILDRIMIIFQRLASFEGGVAAV